MTCCHKESTYYMYVESSCIYESVVFTTTIIPLYSRVGILLTRGKHLHGCIIPLTEEVWAHKTSLTPPHFY